MSFGLRIRRSDFPREDSLLHLPPPRPKPHRARTFWVLRDGRPVRVSFTAGLDDDTFTEVIGDALQVGDEVIVSEHSTATRAKATLRLHACYHRDCAHRRKRARCRSSRLQALPGRIAPGTLELQALRGVSLTIESGEFVAIVERPDRGNRR